MTRSLVGLENMERPARGSAVTIGTFDGVHLGHRELIARAIASATALGATSAVVTWDRHPAETLRPERTPALLTPGERKIQLLSETGLDLVVVIPFDEDFSQLEPEDFVRRVLVDGLGVRSVFVGADWRFGRRAAGDVPLLASLGRELGFEVEGVELQELAGGPVSSSRVRAAVANGDLPLARDLLGRPFDLLGRVTRGAGRGKGLGFPTANLELPEGAAVPPTGVYAGRAEVAGSIKPAAINIGVNPTFGPGGELGLEAYVLDFDADIYDQVVRIEVWERLRDEERFAGVDELVAQIGRDVEATRALVQG